MADKEQDKLAEEWAAALGDDEDADVAAPDASTPDASAPDAAGQDTADDDAAIVDDALAEIAEGGGDDDALADEWAAALAENEQDEVKSEKEQDFLSTQAHDVTLNDMTGEAKGPKPEGGKRDLDFILDIPLEVSAELGRTKLLINELLQLGQGSVVELNKLAGEPLEIYVNGKLVARGEAVVINEKFGIRLTDIISPIERVKQLA